LRRVSRIRCPGVRTLPVDQDVHLHRVVGRRRRRCSAAAAATVAGVIAGVADVGLGDEEAGHLENMWRRRGRRGETVARGVQNDAATAARSALQRLAVLVPSEPALRSVGSG